MTETAVRVESQDDVVLVRQRVRARAEALGFSLVDLTKLVTAASELARNTLVHGGGGTVTIAEVGDRGRSGLQLTFLDEGPGIPDVDRALTDGFSTRGGLGLGLGGAKRLVNEFRVESCERDGTRVTVVKWR